jgi:hypothetical protein
VFQHTLNRIAKIVPEAQHSLNNRLSLCVEQRRGQWDMSVRAKRCRGGGIVMKFRQRRIMPWESSGFFGFYFAGAVLTGNPRRHDLI